MSIKVYLVGKTPLAPELLQSIPVPSVLVTVFLGSEREEHVGLLVETTDSGEEVPVRVVQPA